MLWHWCWCWCWLDGTKQELKSLNFLTGAVATGATGATAIKYACYPCSHMKSFRCSACVRMFENIQRLFNPTYKLLGNSVWTHLLLQIMLSNWISKMNSPSKSYQNENPKLSPTMRIICFEENHKQTSKGWISQHMNEFLALWKK